MKEELRILLLEDSKSDEDLLCRFLKKEDIPFSHIRVWNKENFLKQLDDFHPDLVIADYSLPGFNGMEAFQLFKNKKYPIPFILLTGTVSEKIIVKCMKEGIDDYILKDNLLRLPIAMENVLNKKKLEVQKSEIEKLHHNLVASDKKLKGVLKDIKDSIHYAEKLQQAMLPDLGVLKETFPSSFILFKPKDILSGDFFWYEKDDDTFLLATADCTGHGVPGAMLSMMGYNLLNEIIKIKNILQPADILNRLNRGVRQVLKQDKTFLHDGMDIALCAIDLKTNVLEYAGANRPLYIIRNQELIEIKPDKVPVGGFENAKQHYTNHTFKLKEGDRLFLFTDGFSDQFHIESDKKMSKKRLKELLTTTSEIPVDTQEYVVTSFFDDWKGDKEQVDDVLVVGIEILG